VFDIHVLINMSVDSIYYRALHRLTEIYCLCWRDIFLNYLVTGIRRRRLTAKLTGCRLLLASEESALCRQLWKKRESIAPLLCMHYAAYRVSSVTEAFITWWWRSDFWWDPWI